MNDVTLTAKQAIALGAALLVAWLLMPANVRGFLALNGIDLWPVGFELILLVAPLVWLYNRRRAR